MKLLLRLAEPEDLAEILQIQTLSLRMLPAPNVPEETVEALIVHQRSQREKANELILVVTCNGQIVGFVALMPTQGQISGLFVHPDFVRQGIGSELLAAAEEIMHTKKRRSLFVLASEYAKDFYKKRGFRLVRSHNMAIARHQKVRVFWMRKELRELTPEEKQQQKMAIVVLVLLTIVSIWAAIG